MHQPPLTGVVYPPDGTEGDQGPAHRMRIKVRVGLNPRGAYCNLDDHFCESRNPENVAPSRLDARFRGHDEKHPDPSYNHVAGSQLRIPISIHHSIIRPIEGKSVYFPSPEPVSDAEPGSLHLRSHAKSIPG